MLKGSIVAIVTPFKNGNIDETSLRNLINWHIDEGTHGIVPVGTTGESPTLDHKEHRDVVEIVIDQVNNRVPVIAGAGSNSTSEAISLLKHAEGAGADAALVVTPYYNKPTQEGIYQHYQMISKVCPLPIILYNVPGRTASNITAETTLRLANNFNNIIAVKEASGDMDQIMKIIKNKPTNFIVISGDDGLTLPMIYMGAEGVISVIGQSHPKEYSAMVAEGRYGNISKANKLHYGLYDYYGPLYSEGNPAGVKACLELLGICKAVVRPPLVEVSPIIKTQLKVEIFLKVFFF